MDDKKEIIDLIGSSLKDFCDPGCYCFLNVKIFNDHLNFQFEANKKKYRLTIEEIKK